MDLSMSSMAHHTRSDDPRMFSTSGGRAIGKQIEAIHDPAAIELIVKPILDIVEDIFHRATPAVPGLLQEAHMQMEAFDEKAAHPGLHELIQYLSFTLNRISCEVRISKTLIKGAVEKTVCQRSVENKQLQLVAPNRINESSERNEACLKFRQSMMDC
ncbi:hypothetical protein CCACVL1_24259 [Corchorus capsularis]|uniref:Sieve element occlusion N-terminal domain-containing protein n=1 Tax=Corchorus capsularis TaxID=210143 RepID=A0A1R3GQG1_COCAP|nr:hypothetical protein CCACVL1_24259 [Corchorus capsularis]